MNVDKELGSDPENYRKWQEAMENDKDWRIRRLQTTTEGYLAEVVNRLFDVTRSLEALKGTCNMEKIDLIRHGQVFAYQQGILDAVTELLVYAKGERSLDSDVKDMQDAIIEQGQKKKLIEEGMYQ